MKTLYVASDMDYFEYDHSEVFIDEITLNSKVYRKLDPVYFIWLSKRYETAFKLADKGKFSLKALENLADKIVEIEEKAKLIFSNDEIEFAKKILRTRKYLPPESGNLKTDATEQQEQPEPDFMFPEKNPEENRLSFIKPVSEHALNQVGKIEKKALSKGWTLNQLYQNRGRFMYPCGFNWGLVCFLKDDRKTSIVKSDSIEIICQSGNILKFYNINKIKKIK